MSTSPDIRQKAGEKRKHDGADDVAAKSGRKKRRSRKSDHGHHNPSADVVAVSDDNVEQKKQQKVEKKARQKAAKQQALDTSRDLPTNLARQDAHAPTAASWTLSTPSAGRFLNHDPVFVQDSRGNDFLILANHRQVQLFSLESSLAVRGHAAPNGLSIVCFTIDQPYSHFVRIAYSNNTVVLWDWTTDEHAGRALATKGKVIDMALASGQEGKNPPLYYICDMKQERAIILEDRLLHTTRQRVQSIQILGHGDYILARSANAVLIGAAVAEENSHPGVNYTWVELPLAIKCSCMNARIAPAPSSGKKRAKVGSGLRLAIGLENGQIHLYDDLTSLFRPQEHARLPPPRILHWHREAVSSAKFSRDGNYLISGGSETVLVLWQLETGKRQYLPHLTSAIQRIVVNREGNRYAVQMGDNSVMVLNTTELKPVANFAGLQMLSQDQSSNTGSHYSPAATLHPQIPGQLLLSVPATQPHSSEDHAARPFLQTFDIRNSRHISRQALSRNNATDFNVSPDQIPIVPPDVKHLAISQDGSWLATIDEWMPPSSDVEHLASGETDVEVQRRHRREIFLKFWTWDEVQALWTLTTRVDSPHSCSRGEISEVGSVLAVVPDPATNGFVTVGEDRCVKIWKPRTRARHRAARQEGDESNAVEWTCKLTAKLASDDDRADTPVDVASLQCDARACLAYSADGSMMAVALAHASTTNMPVIHFIDTSSGEMISKPGLAAANVCDLGFLERHLVVVTHPATYVWDIVNDTLTYKIKSAERGDVDDRSSPLLSISRVDETFAIVTSDQGSSTIKIYDVRQSKCIYEQAFDTQVVSLLSGRDARGYTIIFADATIRTVSSATTAQTRRLLPSAPEATQEPASTAIRTGNNAMDTGLDMTGNLGAEGKDGPQLSKLVADDEEDDRPVVRPEQLAGIFDVGQSFAMPPVKDMFHSVVELFGRKPQVA